MRFVPLKDRLMNLFDHLETLELQLLDPDVRGDREALGMLLAEGFCEFGSSGRTFSREAIVELLTSETDATVPKVVGLRVEQIAPDVALVRYTSISETGGAALRASLWILRDGRWQIRFHQGTRIP